MSTHEDNTRYNASLAKCHSRPNKKNWNHKPNIGGFKILGPDEVLKKLEEMGIKRSQKTLQRYAKKGLIPQPDTHSLGRGKGKRSDYPESTPYEFYASWRLNIALNLKTETIEKARKLALSARKISGDNFWSRIETVYNKEVEYKDYFKSLEEAHCYAAHWTCFQDATFGIIFSDFMFDDNPSIKYMDGEMEKYKDFK